MKSWILVADSASARLFEALTPEAPLAMVEQLSHPRSRSHARDLGTDRPGRGHAMAGDGRHGMEPPTDPTVVEAQRFAAELAALLRERRLAGAYERLHLIAPPAFLGLLRHELDDATRAAVASESDKDLSRHDLTQIRAHLPDRL